MRKGAGIAGPPPVLTARQEQRQQYLKTHPNAGQRPGPQQAAPQQQGRPMPPQQGGQQMPMQPMPRPGPGMYPPMQPQRGPSGPWQGGWKAPEGQQQGGGMAAQFGQQFGGFGGAQQGPAPQFNDMMYRYPQGQGPNMGQMQGGIQNAMYTAPGQSPQMIQWSGGLGQQANPQQQMQQMYNQKMNRGGY